MVVVDLQWIKGTQFFSDANEVLAAGTINIYDATTTSLRTTYSNYLGTVANTLNGSNQIVLGADGRLDESVYIPTGLWKVVVKDSLGTTIFTEDNIEGALDTDALAITAALPNTPVVSKTTDYTIVDGYQGKVINANCTGGSFALTLPSAASVGDGWRITVRHVGTANQVTIVGVSSQTIDGATSRALTLRYESVCLVSDGANWHVDGYAPPIAARGSLPFFKVTDRLTAPPASPNPGVRYILNGTGTGLWSSYSQHDVLESDGQGGWIRYTPAEGWFVYVEDENLFTAFVGTAWADQTGMPEPSSSNLKRLVLRHSAAQNTAPGSISATTWTAVPLVEQANTMTGASLSTPDITLPAGTYRINAFKPVSFTSGGAQVLAKSRLRETTTGQVLYGENASANLATNESCNFPLSIHGDLTVPVGGGVYRWEVYTTANASLGSPVLNLSGITENYGSIEFLDLATLQGPDGEQGTQGPQGFAGFEFDFSSTTSMADPGVGIVRLNNATLSSVTAAAIDATSAATGNPDVSDEIAEWNAGGILKIAKIGAEENWVTYTVSAVTDNGSWLQLTLTYRDHAGTISNTDGISVSFAPKGNAGASGSVLPVLDFQFNTATSSDPGSGKLLFNNATLSSATTVSINDLDRLGTDVSAIVAAYDDSGASTMRGHLYVVNATTGVLIAAFKITGSVTDNTTYQTYSVTYIQGAAPSNNTQVALLFVPAGATGAIGGTTGGTDNRLLRSDGTAGTTIQATGISVDDSDNVSGVAAIAASSIELSHASANTLTGSGGDLLIEGTKVRKTGKETIWIPAAAMWARTTNGPGAASRELTTGGDIMIKGWAFDTTTEEGVQFYIGFPKSWDKSTISFQAFWTNASGGSTETVSWGLSAGAYTDDDAIDTTDLGTEVRVSDTWLAQGDMHVTAESAAVTVGNTPIDGDLVIGQIVRSVSNDNMTGDAELLGIKIHFTTNAATDA